MACSTKFRALRVTGGGERNRELDGLRGIAISLVLISHFCDQDVPIMDGHAGVRLFFVLSGFLITNILLQCRGEAERGAATPGTLLLAFYARRCLRIFPTYYLLLAAIGIFDIDQIRGTIWWHAVYASNILAAVRGDFDRVTAHYWTLSIEEQFYLFWPFVVIFTPRSKLSVAAIALVAIGILSRPVALCLNISFVALYTNPFASFDAFGLGALLAITGRNPFLRKVMQVALLLCFAVAPAVVIFHDFNDKLSLWICCVLWETIFLFALGEVVWHAASSAASRISGILSQSVLVYAGQISYGLYLYHMVVIIIIADVLRRAGLMSIYGGPLYILIVTLFSVGTAAVSWHFFELPIQAAKRFFPYGRNPGPGGSSSSLPRTLMINGQSRYADGTGRCCPATPHPDRT